MGVVEIVVLIGEEFDIEVPPDQVARWRSVMDIINTVQDVLRR
ncbi:acyl carrier protein [Pseudomonas sp. WP18]